MRLELTEVAGPNRLECPHCEKTRKDKKLGPLVLPARALGRGHQAGSGRARGRPAPMSTTTSTRSDGGGQAVGHLPADPPQASPGRDNPPSGTTVGTSAPTSTPRPLRTGKSAGQGPGTRGSGGGDNSSPSLLLLRDAAVVEDRSGTEKKEREWKCGSTAPVRGGALAALGLFQRAMPRELWPLVLPHQRCDRSVRDALGDLRDAGKVREELRLPDGRKLWCLTPAGRRDAAGLLPAGTKLASPSSGPEPASNVVSWSSGMM
ncbi:hypothetical protein ACIA8O_37340 [Kitasatospora sp. NPDC051853]|uniref:hypothetical protein n=1 Tax=Kitasatospora sp. NPDC051853 TaxID=3364058 RepID=UPI003795E903